MKVLISAPVNNFTGYGNDGIELVRAFVRWGADVYLHPSAVFPPLPRDVASVITKPLPDAVDLLISHRCPQELADMKLAGVYVPATVALAWSMWEWDSLDNVDEMDRNNCEHSFKVCANLADSVKRFDAILAYDRVSESALSPYHENVHVLQGGVPLVPQFSRDWSAAPFRFLMAGALSTRKNPFAAIGAFKALRDAGELPDAELVLKTTYPGLHPAMESWCPGLRIIAQIWPEADLMELYRTSHVFLAPSWGEGKNIPACQFAMSGGAVALPLIGGHAMWASPEYTFPLEYDWASYSPEVRGAQVREESLIETMHMLYTDRALARKRGELAAMVLPAMVDWSVVLERLMFRLPSYAGARGADVAALMSACRQAPLTDAQRDEAVHSALDPAS